MNRCILFVDFFFWENKTFSQENIVHSAIMGQINIVSVFISMYVFFGHLEKKKHAYESK